MAKLPSKQRELALLTDVNSGTGSNKTIVSPSDKSQLVQSGYTGFHKEASKEDQSIYLSISDSYFKNKTKY